MQLNALYLFLVGCFDRLGLVDEGELALIFVMEIRVLTDVADRKLRLVFVVLFVHMAHARPIRYL